MYYKRVLFTLSLLQFLMGVSMGEGSYSDEIKIFDASTGEIQVVKKVIRADQAWEKILSPQQYRVMRLKDTEQPFKGTCPVPPEGKSGIYQCAGCKTDLFRYNAKFESGTGWPSFWEPVSALNIRVETDNALGMQRSEVLCARCDAHLGHVFDDGPPPTGKRYCINAVALKLMATQKSAEAQKAVFAAGCFWGVEEIFRTTPGVISTRAGYTGGRTVDPVYEEVCADRTGHAEAVEVEFDPRKITYKKLLDIFWSIHDPTTVNRQGPDIGTQYRSAIFYHGPEQKADAVASRQKLEKSAKYNAPIVTEIIAAGEFYPAEEYHQQYYSKKGIKPACQIRKQ